MTVVSGARRHQPAATTPPFWSMPVEDIRRLVDAGSAPSARASRRPRSPAVARLLNWVRVIGRQFVSPIMLILIVAALIAAATGDRVDGSIILGIVVCSALLGAWQEGHAADAVAELLKQVAVVVRVRRGGQDGRELEVPTGEVEPGDELTLAAGDVVPGDCVLLAANGLTVDESALTGEAFPVTKQSGAVLEASTPLARRTNSLFAGTHVVSGTGTALVVLTGTRTTFGHVTASLNRKPTPTSFEEGVRRFGLLLLRVMLILVAVILVINLLLHRPLADSLLFALALAVGITPQMLPVVVTVSLAAGARRMARNKVVVKRLDVIEDLGAMTVLCSDKARDDHRGSGRRGQRHRRIRRRQPAGAAAGDAQLRPADGLPEPARRGDPGAQPPAALGAGAGGDPVRLRAQAPVDRDPRRRHGDADHEGGLRLRALLLRGRGCRDRHRPPRLDRRRAPRTRAHPRPRRLPGHRRGLPSAPREDRGADPGRRARAELRRLLVFHDPVKPDARTSIDELACLNVTVKVISGDSRDVTGSLAAALDLRAEVVTGAQIEAADAARLHELVVGHDLFAEVEPMHKVAIVTALKKAGETVGFLGDGINDAAALHAADVGISVDSAVNVAKEAAAIVLLEKDLAVIATGVRLGRHTFANTLKYVRVAASANFGNILSMVVAAALLPFLPMLPAQILLMNFMSDIPNTLVSRDRVDPERLRRAGT